MVSHQISPDSQVALLLASMLAMPRSESEPPLSSSEWTELERGLSETGLTPADMLEAGESGIRDLCEGLSGISSERVLRLLNRGGALAIELDRLWSLGIWALTRLDDDYPAKLSDRLGGRAPVVLFGAGDVRLLSASGAAIIGSRDIDEAGTEFAVAVGGLCARSGLSVVSGGARGSDRAGMQGALDADGCSVGILADSLERSVRAADCRSYIMDGQLTLCSPYHPQAGFNTGSAMGRNKLIYCLSDFAVVVSSSDGKGGTWQGAVEALKHGWVPVLVRTGDTVPSGNCLLVERGAIPLPETDLPSIDDLPAWVIDHAPQPDEPDDPGSRQLALF